MPNKNKYPYKLPPGLSPSIIKEISALKKEPAWMKDVRLYALDIFLKTPTPPYLEDKLKKFDFSKLHYFIKPVKKAASRWNKLPKQIQETYQKLGIPHAEQNFLGGVNAQYESEAVYKSIKKTLSDKGIIFMDLDKAVQEHPDLVREYFGRLVPAADNKFAALNTACWSGGSFIYVPKNVSVDLPLQSYFRINSARFAQFERTLIIVDRGAFIQYIEGCTAPIYSENLLHAAVVEIYVKPSARIRYTTVQNWSKNVVNLVTKRMTVGENGIGEWIDGNIGSRLTAKYPAIILKGDNAKGEILSLGLASNGQWQDTGAKIYHLGNNTTGNIIAKSVSKNGGHNVFRGKILVGKDLKGIKVKASCDSLILDDQSHADTYPLFNISSTALVEHEATVSKISQDQLFYLQSRGIRKDEAESLIVNGFMEPIVKKLPLEYAVELNRLLNLNMDKEKIYG